MKFAEAKRIAQNHIARLNLPKRMGGIVVQITQYDDEDTLRFLKTEEPDITLESQKLLNAAFAEEMSRRGAHVQFVPVNVADYFSWLGRFNIKDGPANRAQFISWLTAPEPKPTPLA